MIAHSAVKLNTIYFTNPCKFCSSRRFRLSHKKPRTGKVQGENSKIKTTAAYSSTVTSPVPCIKELDLLYVFRDDTVPSRSSFLFKNHVPQAARTFAAFPLLGVLPGPFLSTEHVIAVRFCYLHPAKDRDQLVFVPLSPFYHQVHLPAQYQPVESLIDKMPCHREICMVGRVRQYFSKAGC